MKTAIATLALSLLMISPAEAAKDWKPCHYEDSTNCVWDAKHMGNGEGKSFKVNKKGKVTYISHRRAHRLINR